ncbi:ABC transporter substrate-binding protein [Fredinandcohnia quinoae]|uniref:ABC transporter substrate-binding protein n=1 Tax=Fredinandcohnia quinoae TaxID=2918902 RepID=A0AAW5E7B2_9BACI|nr:ABC transporter substrate-binding protein [Fredinandcohnia sp. SECRCQ15]MCH1625023.1 ABC transporter substrate-binding protein [Fredinandcohnia sp. SECRCQ15]
MKKKRVFALLSTILLMLGLLAGCSSSESGGEGGEGDIIKIGVNLELTGESEFIGKSIEQGLDLALKHVNEEGIGGKTIELVKIDNKSSEDEAKSGATKLIDDDKVIAIIGSGTNETTLAQIDIAQEKKIPLITPTGMDASLTSQEYVFRTTFIDSYQGPAAANFASQDLSLKNAVILIDNASDYSKNLAESFKNAFEENGGKVVSEEEYSSGDTDFAAILANVQSANPEFLYVPGHYEEVGLILKQARELGLKIPFIGGDGWDSAELGNISGKQMLTNAFITTHYTSKDKDKAVATFVRKFKEKNTGQVANTYSALGYDTVFLLADAIKRAGSADPEKIQEALAATDGLALITGTLTFDADRNPLKSITIIEYKDGIQQFIKKIEPKE